MRAPAENSVVKKDGSQLPAAEMAGSFCFSGIAVHNVGWFHLITIHEELIKLV